MQNTEQTYFLKILSDYVHGRKTVLGDDVQMEYVQAIAKSQQLETLFFHQCADGFTRQEEKEMARKKISAALYAYVRRDACVEEIKKAFNEENIQFSLVKGYEIQKLFQPSYVRTMSDTDIIIHGEDREKSHEILTRIGFVCSHDIGHEWHYTKGSVFMEVHESMVHEHEGNEKNVQYFNNLWNHGSRETDYHKLDWNFHFCYLIQHISGHFVMTGIGFRQFLDLVVVIQNIELDWQIIQRELTSLGLWEFALTCLAFCQRWFDVTLPVAGKAIDDDLYEASTQKLFADGVFGRQNKENKELASTLAESHYAGKSVRMSKFSRKWKQLFPAYGVLKEVPCCAFLEGRPYLLPVAWIWRFIYKVFVEKRTKYALEVLQASADDGQVKKRMDYLKQWGL